MVSSSSSLHRQSRLTALNPLAGMNWSEFRKAYSTFIGNPAQGVLHILAAGRNTNWTKWVHIRLARQAAHLKQVKLTINLEQLSQLPEDTLGGAYAKHIISQGFDPEVFVKPNPNEDWLGCRLGLSHDVHHVILGFDGTPVGEFGLAAFVLLQYRDLLNVFVLSFVPLFMLGNPKIAVKILAAIIKGLRMGLACKPIVAYPFEANWHQPLHQVRQELGL